MFQSLFILGRQPGLGIAELESLYGAKALQPLNGVPAVLVDADPNDIPFSRLGGSIKLCKILAELPSTHWGDISKYLKDTVPKHLQYVPEGKLQLGVSVYGIEVPLPRLSATGLELKKVIRAAGRSVRLIPNKTHALNSAQVLHNHLTGNTGWELVLVRNQDKTILAQTLQEQDIEAYAARDQARPKRDARVGMLPPKLAQIIVNLATGGETASGERAAESEEDTTRNAQRATRAILDPFCGTGVLLQEALLMDYNVIGSDIEPRMIDYSRVNLDWLANNHEVSGTHSLIEADATSYTWPRPLPTIAAETYLGRPFSALPAPHILNEVMQDVHTIHRKFLKNVARQTPPGHRMCIAVPAWRTHSGFVHLKTLDSLGELGYTRLSFVHAGDNDLIYYREGQIVGRELVVLERSGK